MNQAPQASAATDTANEFVIADLDHVALNCKGDPLKLAQWYAEVVRFCPIDFETYKAGSRPFPSVRVSPTCILDFFKSDEANSVDANANHICFALSSRLALEDLMKRLHSAGFPPVDDKLLKRSGARGNGWSVYAKDPEGNLLEFRAYF